MLVVWLDNKYVGIANRSNIADNNKISKSTEMWLL